MKPWLWLPAGVAHRLSPAALRMLATVAPVRNFAWDGFTWRGLEFRNRLGIAGGLDKTGANLRDWWLMGAGFLELGTVTPKPQDSNPGKIFARDVQRMALWNRMGFPSPGTTSVHDRLAKFGSEVPRPLFINIGKNRETPNDRAVADYLQCIRDLEKYADAFVVNVSSPNTKGLRDLGEPRALENLLRELRGASAKPLLLKLSPDVELDNLHSQLDASIAGGVDGWILTNTTTQRPNDVAFAKEGGLSGAPLAPLAKEKLRDAVQFLGERRNGRLLISVGGVMTAEDVFERLTMGADLVQVYSTLIFQGPYFFAQVARRAEGREQLLKISGTGPTL